MPSTFPLPDWLPARKAGPRLKLANSREHAANDTFQAAGQASESPIRRSSPATPRLAGAVFASLMLHLGLAVLISSTVIYPSIREAASPPLTVTLAQAPIPTTLLADAQPYVAPSLSPGETQQRENTAPPRQPARFLTDPDLSLLEEIPTTVPGVVTLRLEVTTLGTVERVTVIRADPVPKELLNGLMERFGKARLSPATIGSEPIASNIDVTIRVDPPAQFFDPVR